MNKTWIFDLDGTLVKHNGYLIDGYDTLLYGVRELFERMDEHDYVIITTSRPGKRWLETEKFLDDNNIRYNNIIYDLPHGERILINDKKPDGYKTAYAINKERDGELTVNENFDD